MKDLLSLLVKWQGGKDLLAFRFGSDGKNFNHSRDGSFTTCTQFDCAQYCTSLTVSGKGSHAAVRSVLLYLYRILGVDAFKYRSSFDTHTCDW